MRKLAFLVVAFALLVTGIESIKILAAWWEAGRPPPGMAEILALAALALVGVAWWRHSVFSCGKGACLLPRQEQGQDASDGKEPR